MCKIRNRSFFLLSKIKGPFSCRQKEKEMSFFLPVLPVNERKRSLFFTVIADSPISYLYHTYLIVTLTCMQRFVVALHRAHNRRYCMFAAMFWVCYLVPGTCFVFFANP